MAAELVNVDNFARAETDRMFAALAQQSGGVDRLHHNRVPTPLDQQPVIRMNRDTLYSLAIVDLRDGATLTRARVGRPLRVGDGGEQRPLHQPDHPRRGRAPRSPIDEFDTRYVAVAARVLVDPDDPDDVAARHAAPGRVRGDRRLRRSRSCLTEYDTESLDDTRTALLHLAKNVQGFDARVRLQGRTSTRCGTCSAPRRAGAASPSTRRST